MSTSHPNWDNYSLNSDVIGWSPTPTIFPQYPLTPAAMVCARRGESPVPRKAKRPATPRARPKERFYCDFEGCTSSTARKSDLKRHKLLHLSPAEKNFISHKCPADGCDFNSIQKKNVDIHINTHTRAKPYECPFCVNAYGDPATLTRHKVKQHEYIPHHADWGVDAIETQVKERAITQPSTVKKGRLSRNRKPSSDRDDWSDTSSTVSVLTPPSWYLPLPMSGSPHFPVKQKAVDEWRGAATSMEPYQGMRVGPPRWESTDILSSLEQLHIDSNYYDKEPPTANKHRSLFETEDGRMTLPPPTVYSYDPRGHYAPQISQPHPLLTSQAPSHLYQGYGVERAAHASQDIQGFHGSYARDNVQHPSHSSRGPLPTPQHQVHPASGYSSRDASPISPTGQYRGALRFYRAGDEGWSSGSDYEMDEAVNGAARSSYRFYRAMPGSPY